MTKPEIFFETLGSGPEIILLHGWGFHSVIWHPILPELAKNFRVTLIDLPGFGRSMEAAEYSVEMIAEQLLAVAPPKAIWVGWSLGGLIATKIASMYPERVTKLISVASSPRFLKEKNWPGIDLSVLEKFGNELVANYQATLTRFLLLQFYGTDPNRELIRWLNQNLFTHGKPSLSTLNSGLQLLAKLDLRDDLKKLQCPLLYIFGKLDALVPHRVAETLKGSYPRIEVIIFSKASHAPFLTHEHEFLEAVRRFSYD